MALPTDARVINDVVSSTLDAVRPNVIDLYFRSNALFSRLMNRDKVTEDGGDQINTNILYGKLDGGAYRGFGNFPISTKETNTQFRHEWKNNAAWFSIPGIDVSKNNGEYKLFDLSALKIEACRLTLADNVGTQLYGDGSNADEIDGLQLAIGTTGSYGGITRDASILGTAVQGNVDATGGVITVARVNGFMSTASRGHAAKPDLGITTTTLWDALWSRTQPQQHFVAGDGPGWDVGCDYISINSMAIVADDKCPAGHFYALNTSYIEFVVMRGRDFYLRGPFPIPTQDGWTMQLIQTGNLIVQAPNLCLKATGLTAS